MYALLENDAGVLELCPGVLVVPAQAVVGGVTPLDGRDGRVIRRAGLKHGGHRTRSYGTQYTVHGHKVWTAVTYVVLA